MDLPIRTRPSFPLVSLSHQEVSISFLSLSIRGQTDENHNQRKLIKLITWTTALSNSVELWAVLCRAMEDGWVMVECSDKTWSTGERNGKPLQYSCLENPMNSMKKPPNKLLTYIIYWHFKKVSSIHNVEKIVSSTSIAGETGYSHVTE